MSKAATEEAQGLYALGVKSSDITKDDGTTVNGTLVEYSFNKDSSTLVVDLEALMSNGAKYLTVYRSPNYIRNEDGQVNSRKVASNWITMLDNLDAMWAD